MMLNKKINFKACVFPTIIIGIYILLAKKLAKNVIFSKRPLTLCHNLIRNQHLVRLHFTQSTQQSNIQNEQLEC